MGPLPKEFLERSEKWRKHWDAEGNWIVATAIRNQSFETRETCLDSPLAPGRKIFSIGSVLE